MDGLYIPLKGMQCHSKTRKTEINILVSVKKKLENTESLLNYALRAGNQRRMQIMQDAKNAESA